jgi:hypothetical protein
LTSCKKHFSGSIERASFAFMRSLATSAFIFLTN